MSEANSIASSVGTWVSGLVVLLITYFVAYKMRHITTSGDREGNFLLRRVHKEMQLLRATNEATLKVLQMIKKIEHSLELDMAIIRGDRTAKEGAKEVKSSDDDAETRSPFYKCARLPII